MAINLALLSKSAQDATAGLVQAIDHRVYASLAQSGALANLPKLAFGDSNLGSGVQGGKERGIDTGVSV